ncbi:MAG: histidine kinase, partial [Robiginitalea sp.]
MKKSLTVFLFLFILGLSSPISGQQYPVSVDSLLQTYENKQTAAEKLAYFFQTKDRYASHSAYDWLDRINADLNAAIREGDSLSIQLYRLLRAQVYFDLGNYKKASALANELYPELESMERVPLGRLLDLMDQTYGRLRQYDKQIEIRERKKQFGITEGITFYDIYDNLGLHRKAMNEYIMEVKKTIDSSDFYKLAAYNNAIGQFLLKERSGATAMTYFKKAQGYVVVYL